MRKLSREVAIRQSAFRFCATEGCTTRVYGANLYCTGCYRRSDAGRAEDCAWAKRHALKRKEAARIAAGLPLPAYHCNRCIHWEERCTMGFPEGMGTFAADCSAFFVANTPTELHPDLQDAVQERLEQAYQLAGRQDPAHPQHARYTNVFGELQSKGLSID